MLWFSQVSSEDNHSPSLGWLLGKRGVSVSGTEGTSAVLKEWSRDSWDPEIFSRDLQCHTLFIKVPKYNLPSSLLSAAGFCRAHVRLLL